MEHVIHPPVVGGSDVIIEVCLLLIVLDLVAIAVD